MGAADEGNLIEEAEYISSSGEEDGDEAWRSAINSVAYDFVTGGFTAVNGSSAAISSKPTQHDDSDDFDVPQPQVFKHHQLKAQKALNEIMEKMVVFVRDPEITTNGKDVNDCDSGFGEDGIRLFKDSPIGILLDCPDELQGPIKKPRILPGEEINEKSKKFKWRISSIAVDGTDILAAASEARRKSLARMEAREVAAKEAARRAEERISELKRIRGEKWLPSVVREMKVASGGN